MNIKSYACIESTPQRHSQPIPLRNPPYSRAAAVRLRTHPGPLTAIDYRIYTGRAAWEHARWWNAHSAGKPILCLPPGDDPVTYRWDIARGTEPWVITTGGTPDGTLQRLALELLSAGARVVRVSFWDNTSRPMVVFKEA